MADRAARERIVQEHVERELAHDLEALVQTFTDASSWEDHAASETHDGHNGIRDHYRDLFTGFPDFAFETVGSTRPTRPSCSRLWSLAHTPRRGRAYQPLVGPYGSALCGLHVRFR